MAILATVAFGSRVTLDDVDYRGIEEITPDHVAAARATDTVVRLVGSATLIDGRVDVRVRPSLVDRHHPLAAIEGAFNAVMLQGDAIREITLSGPGAGGIETASAVIADMVSVVGTTGTGFLENDACWRTLERMPPGDMRSPTYIHIEVDDRPGVLAHVAERLAAHEVSIARLDPAADQRNGRPAHRHARGALGLGRRCPCRDRRVAGDSGASDRPSRDLPARRPGPRLDLMPALAVRFRDRLPVGDSTPLVSLGEGGTPLVHAPRLSERLGLDLWLKVEGANPTGSFKDRGMAIAVARALEAGARTVVCASTGNTAASAAAYAARAGLRAVVLVPAAGVAAPKLFQAVTAGARLLEIRGSFDQALDAAQELAGDDEFVLVNSLNPDRIEGQKTAAFEIVEELGAAPDVLALPYGGGGNTCAYARGFEESGELPRLVAGEAADRAVTAASAIRIARPAHAADAEAAIARSGGTVVSLSDDEIRDAWRLLAESEGIVAELSSAAGLAALIQEAGGSGLRAVCVLTGHGLKDPVVSPGVVADQVEPDADAIREAAR